MASNQGESRTSDKRAAEQGTTDAESAGQHSQTLPLITEELAATHHTGQPGTDSTTPTQHVTTPVLPPNPIRRDHVSGTATSPTPPLHADDSARTAQTQSQPPSPESEDKVEKKSDGRISATQLLAGAGAAATSSVIGGQLGVAGTVVGAGDASIVTGLAVTLYSRSLDKGKEKIKEVGQKLAPAVKAQTGAVNRRAGGDDATLVDAQPVNGSAVRPAAESGGGAASAQLHEVADDEQPQTWWQKLRRKRVLYPLTIGVAAFGIGLGAVVMAESFTDADISPGTSQISRSVSGNSSSGDETGTSEDGGSSADSGTSGSGSGEKANQDGGSQNLTSSEGESTSAGEDSSESTSTGEQAEQGTDSSTGSSSDSGSSTASDGSGRSGSDSSGGGTDGSNANSSSSGASSNGGSSSSSGSGSGGSGSSGSGSGSGSGGSGSGSGGGSAGGSASAQG